MTTAAWAAGAARRSPRRRSPSGRPTRAKLPGVPIGVRVTPDWVAAHPALAPQLDYTWAQYATRKGDAQAYFDRAATVGERLGLRVVMGVNTEHCYEAGTSTPCTVTDLVRFGGMAVRHPGSCAFVKLAL